MNVCLSVSPAPASPFSAGFVSCLSIPPPRPARSSSLSPCVPPLPALRLLSLLAPVFSFPPSPLSLGIFLCRSPSAPSFVSPPPSIFCPAEGWLRGLREAACPGHRDGARVRGALRAPSGSRAGGAASLPPARRPGLRRPNNGHIVLAAHRPPPASGGRPDPARGGSGRKPAAQIQVGPSWRRAGDRSAPGSPRSPGDGASPCPRPLALPPSSQWLPTHFSERRGFIRLYTTVCRVN